MISGSVVDDSVALLLAQAVNLGGVNRMAPIPVSMAFSTVMAK
jgi:hypothetical protein